jgi:hypothetical protein
VGGGKGRKQNLTSCSPGSTHTVSTSPSTKAWPFLALYDSADVDQISPVSAGSLNFPPLDTSHSGHCVAMRPAPVEAPPVSRFPPVLHRFESLESLNELAASAHGCKSIRSMRPCNKPTLSSFCFVLEFGNSLRIFRVHATVGAPLLAFKDPALNTYVGVLLVPVLVATLSPAVNSQFLLGFEDALKWGKVAHTSSGTGITQQFSVDPLSTFNSSIVAVSCRASSVSGSFNSWVEIGIPNTVSS